MLGSESVRACGEAVGCALATRGGGRGSVARAVGALTSSSVLASTAAIAGMILSSPRLSLLCALRYGPAGTAYGRGGVSERPATS